MAADEAARHPGLQDPRVGFDGATLQWKKGHGCSTAVEHTPQDQEIVGLNPTGCWTFLLLLSIFSYFSLPAVEVS